MKIENIQRVKEDCLRTQVWKRETAFVEKLEMNSARIKELKNYRDRQTGWEMNDEFNEEGLKAANKFLNKGNTKGSKASSGVSVIIL